MCLLYLPLVSDKSVDYLALHRHIHPVHCIAALVRVDRIVFVASRTRSHRQIVAVVADNNSHPMNYRRSNAIHQHGQLLQRPQSTEIVANADNRERETKGKFKL